jgi:general stress protein 26
MSDVQNLANEGAIEKLRDLIEHTRIAILCSNLTNIPFSSCPMATQKVDEDTGVIWFFTTVTNKHVHEISVDKRVQLIYADNSNSSYLTLFGAAEISDDRQKLAELWNPDAKVWFQDGINDPKLRLLKVTPSDGLYWDTKNGKMVSFLKRMTSLVTGQTMDDSIEGSLTVKNNF